MSLIDTVCEELPRIGAGARVRAVRMKVGALSGVVCDALRFSFDVAVADSAIAGASLEIEEVPVTVYCSHCDGEQVIENPQHLRCPACRSATPNVIRGRELELVAVEVVDDAAHC